ncbi:stalk domain-containing protein [Cellulosilyticum ruminicola]|uniref:stalk domain-containing protein n=1 Tax=Cellulosilyticum ruminicola TaxID=425254 RepID=UPI0006D0E20F|nr:stalk domain-containing protein [Cellulosilyticum ruminicola]
MNKRLMTSMMAIVMGMSIGSTVLASEVQESSQVAIESVQEVLGGFMTEVGHVCTITEDINGYKLQVGNEDGTIFYLKKDALVFDVASGTFKKMSEIKKDMTVSVVYPKDALMMLSLPARCSDVSLVVLHSNEANVSIGYFNDELVNEKDRLQLNINESTVVKSIVHNQKSLKSEDVKNKDAVVVYENTTRSIPAQTIPKLVLVLEKELNQEEVTDISQDNTASTMEEKLHKVDTEVADKPVYIGIRSLAEKNGFEITWDSLKKATILTKDDVQIALNAGESKYFYNKQVRTLKYPVKLEESCMKIADPILD